MLFLMKGMSISTAVVTAAAVAAAAAAVAVAVAAVRVYAYDCPSFSMPLSRVDQSKGGRKTTRMEKEGRRTSDDERPCACVLVCPCDDG